MKSVIKKELKSYFNNPLAYILLCLFIGVSYFFFFRTLFLAGEATVRPYFEVLIWFLMFLVPAITMRTIAAERKDSTLEVMLALPVTEFELLAGKFLADFIFVFGAILISITLPISLLFGGKIDLGVVTAQYIGSFFLVGATVAIGIWASSLTKNQTVALLAGIFAIFGLAVIGLDVIVLGVPYPINNIFQELSLLTHFQNIARGVIDLRDVVYFLSIILVFNAFTYLSFMSRKLNTTSKYYKNLQRGIIIITALAVLVNLFGYYVNWRLDFTADKLYSLSEGTGEVLKGLDDKVTIEFFASQELPPQIAGIYRDVRDTLEDYKGAGGGKVEIIYKFPDANKDAKEEAERSGIPPMQFNIYKQEEFQAKEGYMGLVVSHSDKKESIPFVQRTDDFEYQLTSLIYKMASGQKYKVAFTAGHGEKGESQAQLQQQDQGNGINAFNQELSKQYAVETLDKKKLNEKSLKGINVLIVAGPKQNFSEKEQTVLKSYIENGGKVLALIDSSEVNIQYMTATPIEKSFGDFFKDYGLVINKDVIYDLKANQKVTLGRQEGMGYILPYPFWVVAQAGSSDNVITSGLNEVILPWASSIDVKEPKGKATALLKTTESAGSQRENFNIAPTKNASVTDKGLKQYNLAVALTGLPKGGRVIVVGDADFITDGFAQQHQQGIALGLNAVDWLTQDDVLISIRSKNAMPPKLLFSSDAVKNFIRYFNNFGLVLIIAVYGFYRLAMRRKRTTEAYS